MFEDTDLDDQHKMVVYPTEMRAEFDIKARLILQRQGAREQCLKASLIDDRVELYLLLDQF